jgi:hypothetical protein
MGSTGSFTKAVISPAIGATSLRAKGLDPRAFKDHEPGLRTLFRVEDFLSKIMLLGID